MSETPEVEVGETGSIQAPQLPSENVARMQLYQKDLPCPEYFITWNYLFSVASCLGRKVWVGDRSFAIYPNMYLIFVSPPAVGKSMPANVTESLLTGLEFLRDEKTGVTEKCIRIHPDTATYESMVENISGCFRKEKIDGVGIAHSSMTIILPEELALLFREHCEDLVNFLIAAYNCKPSFIKTTKTSGNSTILNMCLNLLGCCPTHWLTGKMKDAVVGDGLSSRIIYIWGEQPRRGKPHTIMINPEQREAFSKVRQYLTTLNRTVAGEVKYSPEASDWLQDWCNNKMYGPYRNADPVLRFYYGRKKVHLIKTSLAIHFADRTDKILNVEDFINAERQLNYLETFMHKALNTGAQTTTSKLSERIIEIIKARGGVLSEPVIILEMVESTQSSLREIDETLGYLVKVGRLSKDFNGQAAGASTKSKTTYRLL